MNTFTRLAFVAITGIGMALSMCATTSAQESGQGIETVIARVEHATSIAAYRLGITGETIRAKAEERMP